MKRTCECGAELHLVTGNDILLRIPRELKENVPFALVFSLAQMVFAVDDNGSCHPAYPCGSTRKIDAARREIENGY